MTQYFRGFEEADGISDFTEVPTVAGNDAPAWSIVNTNEVQATSASSHNELLAWNDIDGDANRADVELLFQYYNDSTATTQRVAGVRMATSGTRTGYAVRVRTNSIDTYRFTGSTFTAITNTTVSFTSGTWCWVRFRINGTTVRARIWADGDSEPGTWDCDSTDSTYSTAGHVGPLKGANTNTQKWRKFGVGTNGDTAPSSGGAASYTLTVTQGSYALTGQSVGLQSGRKLAVTQGAYALTGQSVGLQAGRKLGVTQGSYALSGQSVTLTYGGAPAGYSLLVTQGAYALSGQSVNLRTGHKLAVTAGAYALSGQSVTLTKSSASGLIITAGNYVLSGQSVNLRTGRRLAVTPGAYVLAGQSVVLTRARQPLSVTAGLYTLTGQDVALRRALRLAVTSGLYALTGRSVVLTYSGFVSNERDMSAAPLVPRGAGPLRPAQLSGGRRPTSQNGRRL